ncbi:hypothetical protein PM082_007376 [Marasmius tenuissimus]|nr:hypothetical protein PM082_007376 [Marasmius tenuissimus]
MGVKGGESAHPIQKKYGRCQNRPVCHIGLPHRHWGTEMVGIVNHGLRQRYGTLGTLAGVVEGRQIVLRMDEAMPLRTCREMAGDASMRTASLGSFFGVRDDLQREVSVSGMWELIDFRSAWATPGCLLSCRHSTRDYALAVQSFPISQQLPVLSASKARHSFVFPIFLLRRWSSSDSDLPNSKFQLRLTRA